MAAIRTPAPANPYDSSRFGSLRLVAGLAALLIGTTVLVGSAVQPWAPFRPVVIPVETVDRTAGVQRSVGHNVARRPQSPARSGPGGEWAPADRWAAAPTTRDRPGGDLATSLARGTRTESAHLATIPLPPDGWDARRGLIEMATAQYHHDQSWVR
jgi:hypothetical protein